MASGGFPVTVALRPTILLLWLGGCGGVLGLGGQSGVEKPGGTSDGPDCGQERQPVDDPSAEVGELGFALASVPLEGSFAGEVTTADDVAPLALRITADLDRAVALLGAGDDCEPGYEVPATVELAAPQVGIDERFEADLFVSAADAARFRTEVDGALATSTIASPDMEGADRVALTFGGSFDGAGWAGGVGFEATTSLGGGVSSSSEGELAAWTAVPE